MTDKHIELSRRQILGSLGTIGVASAGAGLGTSAFFSDEETFARNELVAGSLDLKVDWEEHYSDWSPDEDIDGVTMNETTGELEFANESVQEEFMNATLLERVPNASIRERTQLNESDDEFIDPCEAFPDPDNLERPLIDISDVKPGDFGEVTFSLHPCGNPGYLWMNGELIENRENGLTEPEADDPDENGRQPGELADAIQVTLWYDDDCDNILDDEGEDPEEVILEGSLAEVLDILSQGAGIPLDGDRSTPFDEVVDTDGDGVPDAPADGAAENRDCFENSTTQCLGFGWKLPVDHANEIQTDSVTFDLGFYTEQCRHNDGSAQCPCGEDEYAVEVGGEIHCLTPIEEPLTVEEYYSYNQGHPASVNQPALAHAGVDVSVLFLYRNSQTGDLSLVMIHDHPRSRGGGAATFDFAFGGIAPSNWSVQDDPGQNRPDDYWVDGSGVIARADWSWSPFFTDGGAIPVPDEPFKINIDPAFNDDAVLDAQGRPRDIEQWRALSGDGSTVDLQLDQPCTIYPCDGQDLPLDAGLTAEEEVGPDGEGVAPIETSTPVASQ